MRALGAGKRVMRAASLRLWLVPCTIAVFLAAQGADATLAAGWMLLVLGSTVALLCGAVDWQRPLSRVETAIALVIAAGCASAAFGVDAQRSLLMSVPLLASLLLWILIVRARDTHLAHAAAAAGLAVAACVQAALVLIAAAAVPQAAASEWIARADAAWLVVPNDIGWIACILPLLAAATRRPRAILAILLGGYLALCAFVHSRGAATTALATSVAFIALSRHRRIAEFDARRWFVAIGLAMAAALAVFAFASMRARLQLWQAAWGIFLDHPSTGIGVHNFVLVYRSYLPPNYDLIDARITPWPHNLFLEIAAEWGLIGIVPWAFLAACVARRGWRVLAAVSPAQCAALAGCVGLLLLALAEASFLRQWVWIVGAVLCALLHADRDKEQGQQQ